MGHSIFNIGMTLSFEMCLYNEFEYKLGFKSKFKMNNFKMYALKYIFKKKTHVNILSGKLVIKVYIKTS